MLETLMACKKRQIPNFVQDDFHPFTNKLSANSTLSPLMFLTIATRQTHINFMISSVNESLSIGVTKEIQSYLKQYNSKYATEHSQK